MFFEHSKYTQLKQSTKHLLNQMRIIIHLDTFTYIYKNVKAYIYWGFRRISILTNIGVLSPSRSRINQVPKNKMEFILIFIFWDFFDFQSGALREVIKYNPLTVKIQMAVKYFRGICI